jgi:hypothetical protein
MSLRRSLLGALLLSLSVGACAPAMHQQPATPKQVVVQPQKPAAPSIDRARLRAALEARRQTTMDRFVSFREARVYPVDTVAAGYQHVWMDPYGNLCAAATLISIDWGRPASEAIGAENNSIVLADVHDGPIADWMLTSGMTHHEIVAIQQPDFAGRYQEGMPPMPLKPDAQPVQPSPTDPQRTAEIDRLYNNWTDVERQIRQLWDESLDEATDALMKRPELARALIDGVAAGPGKYGQDVATVAFAQPPPG